MNIDENKIPLLEKIKEGIKKSGFPLEMKIGNLLSKNGWRNNIGNFYTDFETGILRESDVFAVKEINTIEVRLYIECKKSSNKQIVLYAPNDDRGFATHWLKYTPFVEEDNHNVVNDIHIITQFQELNLCNCRTKTSASILITQGDKITSDNLTYISSINSLVKQSIEDMDYNRSNKSRCLYLFILVFDGNLFQLSNSDSEDVDLTEVEYGHYEFQHSFKPLPGYENISYTMRRVSPYYIIEIMTPNYFEEFINKLEDHINNIDINNFGDWGDNEPLNQ